MGNELTELPAKWSDWEVTEKIGRGSYGTVYKIKRILMGKELFCAVKVIDIPRDEDELDSIRQDYGNEDSVHSYLQSVISDYIKEIELMASLKGISNIVTIEDFMVEEKGPSSWRIYIRMEYLQGFLQYSKAHEMSEEEIIRLGTDICSALEYCEKKNIIHRDIKPENIFCSEMGDFKLGDFGVAREGGISFGSYSSKGTFSYMAPEVYMGRHYNVNADIYSLGIVLYRLTNKNRLPFENVYKQIIPYHEREEAFGRRINGEALPKPVNASAVLSEIILKACAFEPQQRYKNAAEMKSALAKCMTGGNAGKSEEKSADKGNEKQQGEAPFASKAAGAAAASAAASVAFGAESAAACGNSSAKENKEEKGGNKVLKLAAVAAIAALGFFGGQFVMHSNLGTGISAALDGFVSADIANGVLTESDSEEESDESETNSEDIQIIDDTVSDAKVYLVTGSNLNVRATAVKEDDNVVAQLSEGTQVTGTGNVSEDEKWLEIYYSSDDPTKTGWASAAYLQEVSNEDASATASAASATNTSDTSASGTSSSDSTASDTASTTFDTTANGTSGTTSSSDTTSGTGSSTSGTTASGSSSSNTTSSNSGSSNTTSSDSTSTTSGTSSLGTTSSDTSSSTSGTSSSGTTSSDMSSSTSGTTSSDTSSSDTATATSETTASTTTDIDSIVSQAVDDFVESKLNTFNLSIGDVHQPSAAVWMSSSMASVKSTDTSVVTVSSGGKVTAVGKGTAYVVFIVQNSLSTQTQAYKYVVS